MSRIHNFKAHQPISRDALTPRTGGLADASLSSNMLLVQGSGADDRGGDTIVEGFSDDYYVVQAYVDLSDVGVANLKFRYIDANNYYQVHMIGYVKFSVQRYKDGEFANLGGTGISPPPSNPVTLRVRIYDDNGQDKFGIYVDGELELTVTDNVIPYGGVAFGGDNPKYDNVKIGYDNSDPPDGDISDGGDKIVWDEDFNAPPGEDDDSKVEVFHDHAGNLIDDGDFRYVYDAWNRLVKVQASEDSGAVTIQTAEFDGRGRRIKKGVDSSGQADGTVVYLYDGQKIIETRDGSGNLYQQVIHGIRYIDEVVMVRVKDKGDLYVHQDANWNVIGLTDLGGSLVERHVYRPYGELTVNQETGFGDRDGDGDVDATDKGTPGSTCTGTVTGACRILDLDFDGDYDTADATLFDALPQGLMRHPGRIATNVHQPFGHQGLLFEPEIGSYQNRARQYHPAKRRFLQRDPSVLLAQAGSGYHDGLNVYGYVKRNPLRGTDPTGLGCCECDCPEGCEAEDTPQGVDECHGLSPERCIGTCKCTGPGCGANTGACVYYGYGSPLVVLMALPFALAVGRLFRKHSCWSWRSRQS